MSVLVWLMTLRSRNKRSRNRHILKYSSVPTGKMMAAMMLSHFRSNGRVCALTERTGYWFMSCRIYLLAVLVKSSITSSNSALILSIS